MSNTTLNWTRAFSWAAWPPPPFGSAAFLLLRCFSRCSRGAVLLSVLLLSAGIAPSLPSWSRLSLSPSPCGWCRSGVSELDFSVRFFCFPILFSCVWSFSCHLSFSFSCSVLFFIFLPCFHFIFHFFISFSLHILIRINIFMFLLIFFFCGKGRRREWKHERRIYPKSRALGSSSVEPRVYRGCPCRDPPVCHRVPGWLWGKALTDSCGCCEVTWSSCSWSWSCFTFGCNWVSLHPCSTGSAARALSRLHSQSFQLTRSNSLRSFGGLWVFSQWNPSVTCSSNRSKSHRTFFCSLPAVSQSILFTQLLICPTSRRLINFERCRVCSWNSLPCSRRLSRRQQCCEHLRLSSWSARWYASSSTLFTERSWGLPSSNNWTSFLFDCSVNHLGVLLHESGSLGHLLPNDRNLARWSVSTTFTSSASDLLKSFASLILTVFAAVTLWGVSHRTSCCLGTPVFGQVSVLPFCQLVPLLFSPAVRFALLACCWLCSFSSFHHSPDRRCSPCSLSKCPCCILVVFSPLALWKWFSKCSLSELTRVPLATKRLHN